MLEERVQTTSFSTLLRNYRKWKCIWVRSRNWGCLVAWFCCQLIAKASYKTASVPWPDPFYVLKKISVWQGLNHHTMSMVLYKGGWTPILRISKFYRRDKKLFLSVFIKITVSKFRYAIEYDERVLLIMIPSSKQFNLLCKFTTK